MKAIKDTNNNLLAAIDGKGYGLDDARQAIEIIHNIRNSNLVVLKGEYYPFAKQSNSTHPFFRI